MLPRETIAAFDLFLKKQGLYLEAVVVGGAALALIGVTERQTRDVDVLHPDLPAAVADAARAFAARQRAFGHFLADDWLNNGPSQLKDTLPEGWMARSQAAFSGEALTLLVLGRGDLLKTKFFSLCDRGTDLGDCLALAPSEGEIDEAESWVALQDAHPDWPEHVRRTLDDLRKRVRHGV